MNKDTRLSFSAFECYEGCPYRFKKLYIERVKEPSNKYGLYGTAFHDLLDTIYKTQNFVHDSAIKLWPAIFEKEAKKPRYSHILKKALEEQQHKGTKDLKTWFKMAEQERILRPCISTETKLEGTFMGSPLNGRTDLVTNVKGGIALVDWKTGASDEKNLMQLALYAVLYFKKEGVKIDWLVPFYIKTKEVVYQACNDDIIAKAGKFFGDLYNRMVNDTEYLPKKSDNCYFCSFRNSGECPLFRRVEL
jgi:CRISPR/Cas system-associated exonuclease Cas4 (RecB family)